MWLGSSGPTTLPSRQKLITSGWSLNSHSRHIHFATGITVAYTGYNSARETIIVAAGQTATITNVGTLQILARYSPEFPCSLRDLANFVPASNKLLGKGDGTAEASTKKPKAPAIPLGKRVDVPATEHQGIDRYIEVRHQSRSGWRQGGRITTVMEKHWLEERAGC